MNAAAGSTVPAPPPALPGAQPLTWPNAARLSGYALRDMGDRTAQQVFLLGGLLAVMAVVAVGLGYVTWTEAVLCLLFVIVVGPLLGTAFGAWWVKMGKPWRIGFFDRTGTLLIRPTNGRWEVTDHHATTRNTGSASEFRRRAFAWLADHADDQDVTISMDTSVEKLRVRYVADMPGLRWVGTIKRQGRAIYLLKRTPGDHTSYTAQEPPRADWEVG